MNTEATQDHQEADTTGARLRHAREQLGLSQQAVAKRLCLKVSTVHDIEDDKAPADLISTFLRSYIRSYARLIHIPEEELLPTIAKQAPIHAAKIVPVQNFSLGERRKKRNGWLMSFTQLVLSVVVDLSGAWWWQDHKAQREKISAMADQSSAELNGGDANSQNVPLDTSAPVDSGTDSAVNNVPINTASTPTTSAPTQTPTDSNAVVTPSQASIDTAEATPTTPTTPASPLPTDQANVATPAASAQGLAMNFSTDCWLEVSDATGKKLFSGLQRKGDNLNLSDQASYKLKIGAPVAVRVQLLGKPVDLSRFIRTSQVARLTLSTEQSPAQ